MNGIGTEINIEKGFELYNKAAGENDSDLKINIGLIYKKEKEIVNDLDKVN